MNLSALLIALRGTNTVVNPNGYFSHGRKSDVSLDSNWKFDSKVPTNYLIYLLPVRIQKNINDSSAIYTCTLGCFRQDKPDSTPQQMESILNATEAKLDEFMMHLYNNYTELVVRSWEGSPEYRDLSGTYTGHAIVFQVESKLDVC